MSFEAREIGPQDVGALKQVLTAGGAADAWLRHALRVGGTRGFLGAFDDAGRLVGAALLRSGALCAASGTSHAAVEALLPRLRRQGPWFSIVGPEVPCAQLVRGLAGRSALRVNRVQVFMRISDPGRLGPTAESLRKALPSDLDELIPLVVAYRQEDGLTPAGEDPTEWLQSHMATRIESESVYVLEERGAIVFTGAFNFRGVDGAGLGGIYAVPDVRGRGIAARATASMCRIGLLEGPVVTLHVDARNRAALRCYSKAGLEPEGEYRLTFR